MHRDINNVNANGISPLNMRRNSNNVLNVHPTLAPAPPPGLAPVNRLPMPSHHLDPHAHARSAPGVNNPGMLMGNMGSMNVNGMAKQHQGAHVSSSQKAQQSQTQSLGQPSMSTQHPQLHKNMHSPIHVQQRSHSYTGENFNPPLQPASHNHTHNHNYNPSPIRRSSMQSQSYHGLGGAITPHPPSPYNAANAVNSPVATTQMAQNNNLTSNNPSQSPAPPPTASPNNSYQQQRQALQMQLMMQNFRQQQQQTLQQQPQQQQQQLQQQVQQVAKRSISKQSQLTGNDSSITADSNRKNDNVSSIINNTNLGGISPDALLKSQQQRPSSRQQHHTIHQQMSLQKQQHQGLQSTPVPVKTGAAAGTGSHSNNIQLQVMDSPTMVGMARKSSSTGSNFFKEGGTMRPQHLGLNSRESSIGSNTSSAMVNNNKSLPSPSQRTSLMADMFPMRNSSNGQPLPQLPKNNRINSHTHLLAPQGNNGTNFHNPGYQALSNTALEEEKKRRPNLSVNPQQPMRRGPQSYQQPALPTKEKQINGQFHFMNAIDILPLINDLTWEQKVVYIARHVLAGTARNSFFSVSKEIAALKKDLVTTVPKMNKSNSMDPSSSPHQGNHDLAFLDNSSVHSNNSNSSNNYSSPSHHDNHKLITPDPYTAKRIMIELGMGLSFCKIVSSTIESVLAEIDPYSAQSKSAGTMRKNGDQSSNPLPQQMKPSKRKPNQLGGPVQIETVAPKSNNKKTEAVKAGNPNGSTLRKVRDKQRGTVKAKDFTVETILLPSELEKRSKMTKKQLSYRQFEMTRFRSLRMGDYVAARPRSQDLWILAKVMNDWFVPDIPLQELIAMSDAKRDAFLQTKVALLDVEDIDTNDKSRILHISRQFVLPLPRSFEEASEWCMRCRKSYRVYAMYPSTTSLYAATVVDSTTYCREDDDIVVVEFDGDELDAEQKLPQKHIPARFVTLIPQNFPAAKVKPKRQRKPTKKNNAGVITAPAPNLTAHKVNQQESKPNDEMPFSLVDLDDLGEIDDFFSNDMGPDLFNLSEDMVQKKTKLAEPVTTNDLIRHKPATKGGTNTKVKRAKKPHGLPSRNSDPNTKKKRNAKDQNRDSSSAKRSKKVSK